MEIKIETSHQQIDRKERGLMKSDGVDIALNPSVLDFVEDIKTLEQACLAVARHLFVALIEALDDALLAQKPKHYKCVGKRRRTLSTLIGDIVIHRRLYVHASKKRGKKKGSKARFLLDERLNIQPRRRVTHGLLRLIVSAATRLSFREVSEMLEEAGFPRISHTTIHNEVRRYGELQSQVLQQSKELLFVAGQRVENVELRKVPVLFIEADGIIVNCQGADTTKLELKLAAIHEGWEELGKRRKLKKATTVIGLFNGGDDFWETVTAQLMKTYDLTDTQIVINGDGADWIQKTAKDYFADAIVQLDRYHLIRDLRLAVGQKAANDLLAQLDRGDVTVFVDTLEAMAPKIPEKRREVYGKLLNLCKKYPEHLLDYRHRLGNEYEGIRLHGMGAAETMVDKKVANRMKKRGMLWSRIGACAMASLLMLRSNDQLFQWLDRHPENDVLNPVPRLRQQVITSGHEAPGEWLRVAMPSLGYSTKPWVIALRNLSGFSTAL